MLMLKLCVNKYKLIHNLKKFAISFCNTNTHPFIYLSIITYKVLNIIMKP